MTDAPRRVTRGSSDAAAWVRRDELDRLPLVDLARTGARLVGLTVDR